MSVSSEHTLPSVLEAQLDRHEATLLRGVLVALDNQVRVALQDAVVGVYVKGSFALGSGDLHSDVDFLVVTRQPLTATQVQRVRDLHGGFPDRPEHWAHVLEGSYAPAEALRGRAGGPPWLYVDNGRRTMELSSHDDTEVFRWVLKHRGVAISGPPSHSLVPEVPVSALRDEAALLAEERRDSALADPAYLANGWGQPHEVLTQCRMLYTASTGEVCGKADAARWSLEVLSPQWHPLVEAAVRSRPNPWQRVHERADPELTRLTESFLRHMAERIVRAARDGGTGREATRSARPR